MLREEQREKTEGTACCLWAVAGGSATIKPSASAPCPPVSFPPSLSPCLRRPSQLPDNYKENEEEPNERRGGGQCEGHAPSRTVNDQEMNEKRTRNTEGEDKGNVPECATSPLLCVAVIVVVIIIIVSCSSSRSGHSRRSKECVCCFSLLLARNACATVKAFAATDESNMRSSPLVPRLFARAHSIMCLSSSARRLLLLVCRQRDRRRRRRRRHIAIVVGACSSVARRQEESRSKPKRKRE